MKRKNLIIYTFAFLLTYLISEGVYRSIYMVPELKDQGPMLYNLMEYQWHNDALYIGESSNIWVSPEDNDKRNISDMINDSLQGFRLSGLQAPAYHAGLYLPVIERISPASRVRHIVVTMNLRSFGKPWIFSTLEGQLQRTRCFYATDWPLFNRLRATLGAYENPDPAEQDEKMLHAFAYDTLKTTYQLPFNTIKRWCEQVKFPLPEGGEDFPKRVLADHYVKAYAFQIDTNTNPRIRDFDKMVKVCKSKGIRLYFHILAENTEWADSLIGPELVQLMRDNRNLLRYRYSKMGVTVIDNLETVPGKHFAEKNWTTEHYDQTGRSLVADRVRKILQDSMCKTIARR